MNNVINVLENMASNALLTSKDELSSFLNTTTITPIQKAAITAKDMDVLTETIHDLPEIKCIPVFPAEDDDENQENDGEEKQDDQENTNNLNSAANF